MSDTNAKGRAVNRMRDHGLTTCGQWRRENLKRPCTCVVDVKAVSLGRMILMNTYKHIVTLLQESRDLIQVLVVREHLDPSAFDLSALSERHSRSWSLLAHREAAEVRRKSGDSNFR